MKLKASRLVLAALLLTSTAASAADKVRASIFKIGASTNAWIAKTQGFFAKNNLDVEFIEFRNGNEAVTANRGGSVDIIMSIPGTVMIAAERGTPVRAVHQGRVVYADWLAGLGRLHDALQLGCQSVNGVSGRPRGRQNRIPERDVIPGDARLGDGGHGSVRGGAHFWTRSFSVRIA